jgi:hypothetical protein
LPLLPPEATFLLVEVPRHLEVKWGRTDTDRVES